MMKFESYLAINNNNNKNNAALANYNKKLDQLYAYTPLLICQKMSLKWLANCFIVWNLTTKPMPTFWVGE